jgi:hypothetical protein
LQNVANNTQVSKQPLSLLLDGQTFLLETDIDTDYAHLPVRTFLLFEALGRPEWVSACDWYMKLSIESCGLALLLLLMLLIH